MLEVSNSKMAALTPSLIKLASMQIYAEMGVDQTLKLCLMKSIESYHQMEFIFALPMEYLTTVWDILIRKNMTGQCSLRKLPNPLFPQQQLYLLVRKMTIKISTLSIS